MLVTQQLAEPGWVHKDMAPQIGLENAAFSAILSKKPDLVGVVLELLGQYKAELFAKPASDPVSGQRVYIEMWTGQRHEGLQAHFETKFQFRMGVVLVCVWVDGQPLDSNGRHSVKNVLLWLGECTTQ